MIKHTKEFHNKIKKNVFSNPVTLAEYKAFSLELDTHFKKRNKQEKN